MAIWEPEEEEALVTYLHTQAASAGDGVNFTVKTFTSASQKLLVDFPAYRGGEKTASSCRSKWIRVSLLSLIYAMLKLHMHLTQYIDQVCIICGSVKVTLCPLTSSVDRVCTCTTPSTHISVDLVIVL